MGKPATPEPNSTIGGAATNRDPSHAAAPGR
jgi:hypothetical protein